MIGSSLFSARHRWWLWVAACYPWMTLQGHNLPDTLVHREASTQESLMPFRWDTLAVQTMENLWESALWPSLLDRNSSLHSSVKPWNALHLPQELRGFRTMDPGRSLGRWAWPGSSNRSLWSFVSEGKDVGLRLDPLLSLGLGIETASLVTTLQNTRGIRLLGFMGNRLRFQSSIGLHNPIYPLYLHEIILQHHRSWVGFGAQDRTGTGGEGMGFLCEPSYVIMANQSSLPSSMGAW